jgi:hypothetical protein
MSLMDTNCTIDQTRLQAEIDSEKTENVNGMITDMHPPTAKFQNHTAYIAFTISEAIVSKCPALTDKEELLAQAIRIVPRPSSQSIVINTVPTLATILINEIAKVKVFAEDGVIFSINLKSTDREGSGVRTSEGQFVIVHVGAFSTTPLTTIRRIVTTEAGKLGIDIEEKWTQMMNSEKTHRTGRYSASVSFASHFHTRLIGPLANIAVAQGDIVHLQLSNTLAEEFRLCKRCLMAACFFNSKDGKMLCVSQGSATDGEKKRRRENFQDRAKRLRAAASSSGAQ